MASAVLRALLLGLASIVASAAYAQSDNPIFVQTQPTAMSHAFRADIPAADRAAAALTEKARRAGEIRVIAELKSITDIDDTLSPSASLKQAARLTRAQNAMLSRVLRGAASTGIRRFQFIPFVALKVNAAQLKRLLADPDIASVEEDTFAQPEAKAQQWDIAKIDLPQVWKLGVKGTGYTVAVLDTGFQDDHPMLAGRFVSEACYSTTELPMARSLCKGGAQSSIAEHSATYCPLDIRGCSHGTHVAGIAAGASAEATGVAIGGKLIGIQVFSKVLRDSECNGAAPCVLTFTADQVAGLERVYALRNTYKIAAVNMSLGGGASKGYCNGREPARAQIIGKLRKANIATIVASGNAHLQGEISAPACIRSAIAVGSTEKNDTVSAFSNHSSIIALMAPGNPILSAVPIDEYKDLGGTSMAAPHVAGAFAVLRQAAPQATVDDIERALAETGVPVTRNNVTKPRIDMLGAFNALTLEQPETATR